MNGDILNDAVYQRRVDAEDYLGIKLSYEYQSSLWNEESQYVSALTSATRRFWHLASIKIVL